jgi:1-acyl-sn-glycerol-3-phosphate acyltransferase
MRIFRIALGNIWRFWFFFEAIVTFFLLYPVFCFTLRGNAPYEKAFKWMKVHARMIVFLSGIKVEVINRYTPKRDETYVICPNHISYLDIVLTYIAFPHYFHFMGKAELKRVPFFNIFFKKMNIGVERESRSGSHKAYMRASDDLQKNISISIFPEATIPLCNPELGPMKNGAFKLAIENQVKILPIVFIDNWKVLPDVPHKIYGGKPCRARIVIADPIETKGLEEKDSLLVKQKYREIMQHILQEFDFGKK